LQIAAKFIMEIQDKQVNSVSFQQVNDWVRKKKHKTKWWKKELVLLETIPKNGRQGTVGVDYPYH
jgi:hypothetical protein